MAFYGSSVANLSPILFRGGTFSTGVNIVLHADISRSMNLIPNGNVSFLDERPDLGVIGAGSTISMFYDGIFAATLQQNLFDKKVGTSEANLFTYVDQTLRSSDTPNQIITKNTEDIDFPPSIIIGQAEGSDIESDYRTYYGIWKRWTEDYITKDEGSFDPDAGSAFQKVNKTADGIANDRILSVEPNSTLPGIYSEDVHGTIFSLYYSNGENPNPITDGNVSIALIGKHITNIVRRNNDTFLITHSNEQENSLDSLSGIGVSTKTNVGYTTSKYSFASNGIFFRRFKGYYEDENENRGIAVSGNDLTTETFREWFDLVAEPFPLGTRTDILDADQDAPGCNWYVNSEPNTGSVSGNNNILLGISDLGGDSVVDLSTSLTNTDPPDPANPGSGGYGDIELNNSPDRLNPITLEANTVKGGFWGPVLSIDRFRSDIDGYSAMAIGYFQPTETGVYSFALQSVGASFFWIARDDEFGNIDTASEGIVYGTTAQWQESNATLRCPESSSVRFRISRANINGNSDQRREIYTVETGIGAQDSPVPMTAGRRYPFRLIMGNPEVGSSDNVFPTSGNPLEFSETSTYNPSYVKLLFDVNTDADVANKEYKIDGSGRFFGGTELWEEGSPFFPPRVGIVTRTVEEEVEFRKLRVIGISGYESTDGHDAVFFQNSNYRYIDLDGYNYTQEITDEDPESVGGWAPASYFDPVKYNTIYEIPDDTSGVFQTTNAIRGNTNVEATNATFIVKKLNDRYLTSIKSGSEGDFYRVGDVVVIQSNLLDGSVDENNLYFRIDNLEEIVYSDLPTTEVTPAGVTAAEFGIQKNFTGTPEYRIDILDGGAGYEVDGRVTVKGVNLDGVSGTPGDPVNDLIVEIVSVDGSGGITSATILSPAEGGGTPTSIIEYNPKPLSIYNPRRVELSYDNDNYSSLGYRNGNATGIAYTAVTISGIAYSGGTTGGIGHSAYSISGIAYTSLKSPTNVSIGHSFADLVGISYTTNNVIGAAYTNALISGSTGVAYTGAPVVSIGWSNSQVTGIAYTTPSVTSIGYTAYTINQISYPDAIGITSITRDTGNRNLITLEDPTIVNDLGSSFDIIITGFAGIGLSFFGYLNGAQTVTGVGNSEFEFNLGNGGDTPDVGDYFPIDPNIVKIIVTNYDPGDGSIGGIGTAVIETVENTPSDFNTIGDDLLIRGIVKPDYPDWEAGIGLTVGTRISPNQFYAGGSSTVGFFTSTTLGAGSTVGYDQAELELEIAATFKSVGITSIAYDLGIPSGESITPYRVASNGRISGTAGFDGFRQTGSTPFSEEYRICLESQNATLQLSNYLDIGDIVYFFETQGVFDYNNIGYGLTVTDVTDAADAFRFDVALGIGPGSDFTTAQNGYYIIDKLIPIVDATSHGFVDGDLVKISGNENSVYNNTWQVTQAGINTFRLADAVTGIVSTSADLITNSGNTLNLSGIASASPTEYKFEVGMGITVFGVTGESAIYNDGYVIAGIKSAITDPYAFILKENQTPTELAVRGTSGDVGIHTIGAIASLDTTDLGTVGETISLKIQDASATFFNQVYNDAVITSPTSVYLGSGSFRDETTPNPEEYNAGAGNVTASTISGRVGSTLMLEHGALTPSYGVFAFNPGDQIDVFGTTTFNSTYTVESVSGSVLSLTATSGINTDFSLSESGDLGVRDLAPTITFIDNYDGGSPRFPTPTFGPLNNELVVKIQGSGYSNLDGLTFNARVIVDISNQGRIQLLDATTHNPPEYNVVGVAGTIGFVGSPVLVELDNTIVYPEGSQVRLEAVLDQYLSNFIFNPANTEIYNVERIISNNAVDGYEVILGKFSNASTDFGLVGVGGTLGLLENAVVSTGLTSHPFKDGDNIKIEGTVGNGGRFNYSVGTQTFNVQIIDDTSFILINTNFGAFTDTFIDANTSGGRGVDIGNLATLEFELASLPQGFEDGNQIRVEDTGLSSFDGDFTIVNTIPSGSTQKITINKSFGVSDDVFENITFDDTTPDYQVTPLGIGPVVTYTVSHLTAGGPTQSLEVGDQIRIQDSGNPNFDGNYTVYWADTVTTSGSRDLGILPSDPTSFIGEDVTESTGVLGLEGSPLRVRVTGHTFDDGDEIKLQFPSTFAGRYTVRVINANIIALDSVVSNGSTDFTLTDTGVSFGYIGYPAVATIDPSSLVGGNLPLGFENGSSIDIVGLNQPFPTSTSTIQIYGGSPFKIGLLNAITEQDDYTINYNNSGVGGGYTGGLRNSDPIITFSSTDAFTLGITNPVFQVGENVPIDITGTSDFVQTTYTTKKLNDTQLLILGATNPSNRIYSPSDTNFNVGLANSDRIVTTLIENVITESDIGKTIFINTGNTANQSDPVEGTSPSFGGEFIISEVLDGFTFVLRTSSDQPTALSVGSDYTVQEIGGYFVESNRGVRVRVDNSGRNNHGLNVGDSITLSRVVDVPSGMNQFNQSFNVSEVINSSTVLLDGPYPSPVSDSFGINDYRNAFNPGAGATAYFVSNEPPSTISGIEITRNSSTYQITGYANVGLGYTSNQEFLILGSNFGGTDGFISGDDPIYTPNNDLIIQITSVSDTGQIINATPIGVSEPTLDYSPQTFLVEQKINEGSGAEFTVSRSGQYDPVLGFTTYTSVTVTNGGQFYQVNEVLLIRGDLLEGETPLNDLYIEINEIGTGNSITGFGFTGISKDGLPLSTAGITTLYQNPTIPTQVVSRPFGLEGVWDSTLYRYNEPPQGQGELKQKHDILSLARINKGGIIKADRVYQYGDIVNKEPIKEIFMYSTTSLFWKDPENNGNGSIAYPSSTTSPTAATLTVTPGEATICLAETPGDDDESTWRIDAGDEIYILTEMDSSVINASYPLSYDPYVDYRSVGYAMTVTRKNQSGASNTYNGANEEVGDSYGRGFNRFDLFDGEDGEFKERDEDGFIFGPDIDQLVVETSNTNAVTQDSVCGRMHYLIIRAEEPVRVRCDDHNFQVGDKVYLRYTQLFDFKTFIDPASNTGLAGTSYIVESIEDNNFTIEDESGNTITASTVLPDGKKVIDRFLENYRRPNVNLGNWEGGDLNVDYGSPAALTDWNADPGCPVIPARDDTEGNNPPTGDQIGDWVALTRSLLSVYGEAYTLVPGGNPPLDNRIALARALAQFISDTTGKD